MKLKWTRTKQMNVRQIYNCEMNADRTIPFTTIFVSPETDRWAHLYFSEHICFVMKWYCPNGWLDSTPRCVGITNLHKLICNHFIGSQARTGMKLHIYSLMWWWRWRIGFNISLKEFQLFNSEFVRKRYSYGYTYM